MSVELASPDHFLPALPGWQNRSEFITRNGQVDSYNYDFYGQALAKILRCHAQDLSDAEAYVELGKVNPQVLLELLQQIGPELIRYPAIDAESLLSSVESFVQQYESL